jgi:hypothetical protein
MAIFHSFLYVYQRVIMADMGEHQRSSGQCRISVYFQDFRAECGTLRNVKRLLEFNLARNVWEI